MAPAEKPWWERAWEQSPDAQGEAQMASELSGGNRRAKSESQIHKHAFRECIAGRASWT